MVPKESVTISDIAERAQVSISTVSRVLRGTTKVADSKRSAVLAAVAELNYQPNVFAQGLASGQSMAIGVQTQNFGSPFFFLLYFRHFNVSKPLLQYTQSTLPYSYTIATKTILPTVIS